MGVHGVDEISKMAKSHEEAAGGKYIKLKDHGDSFLGVFIGDPYAREVVWVDQNGIRIPEEFDAKIHAGEKPKMLVSWNVYDFDQKEVRVWQQGVTFFKIWLQADEKYGRAKWIFEVKRSGKANDQKTTYAIFPDRELTASEIKMVGGLDLHDFENRSNGSSSNGGAKNGSSVCIDADTANALIADLKVLKIAGKDDVVDSFLKEFEVGAIRDVTTTQKDEAVAFVANHMAIHNKLSAKPVVAAAVAEQDPFA